MQQPNQPMTDSQRSLLTYVHQIFNQCHRDERQFVAYMVQSKKAVNQQEARRLLQGMKNSLHLLN